MSRSIFLNPFVLGRIGPKDPFCNRKKEIKELTAHAMNCTDVVVYSPRRLGKTSLLGRVMDAVKRRGYLAAYADLMSIVNEKDLIDKMVDGIVRGVGKNIASRSFPKRVEGLFSKIVPEVTIRGDSVGLSIRYDPEAGTNVLLTDVFRGLSGYAKKNQKKILFVIDEVQEVTDLRESKRIEGLLREHIQGERNIAYFFVGSRRRVLQAMFTDKKRPFYKSAFSYPVSIISKEELCGFIRHQFAETGKNCSEEIAGLIYDFTAGSTYYVQKLSYMLWNETEKKASMEVFSAVQQKFLELEGMDHFEGLFRALTYAEKVVLRALAGEPTVSPYAAAYLRSHEVSQGTMQKGLDGLLDRDLAEREDGGPYRLVDQVLGRWLNDYFTGVR
jgi:hypothetical protein